MEGMVVLEAIVVATVAATVEMEDMEGMVDTAVALDMVIAATVDMAMVSFYVQIMPSLLFEY